MRTHKGTPCGPPNYPPWSAGVRRYLPWSYLIVLVVIGIGFSRPSQEINLIHSSTIHSELLEHSDEVASRADPQSTLPPPRHNHSTPTELLSSESWISATARQLEEQARKPREISRNEGVEFELHNAPHKMTSRVSDALWEVHGIPADEPTQRSSWHWRYTLRGIHRGDQERVVNRGLVSLTDDLVTITRSSGLREWYRNKPEGIEQGFEIAERPHGAKSGSLILRGTVETDLKLSLSSPQEVRFTKNGEETLRYAGLKVLDAKGDSVPAWLSYTTRRSHGTLDIHIDDRNAVYPLSVDPVASSSSWSYAGGNSSYFGERTSTAGDVNGDGYSDVIVSYGNNAYSLVFHGSSTGLATTAAWTKMIGNGGSFGNSGATAGDVNGDGYSDVVVGGHGLFQDGVAYYPGEAYVFLGSASGLATTYAWFKAGANDWARYGYDVKTAGDVNGDGYSDVIVASNKLSNGQTEEGGAYVYLGSSSGLVTTTQWTAETNQAYANLPTVSTAGDVNGDGYSDIIIGSNQYDNGSSNEGQARVYYGSSSGVVATQAWSWEANSNDAFAARSVSNAGDVNGDGYGDVIISSSAHVFHGSASGLSTTANWTAPSGGGVVAFGGDANGDGYADVLVGSPWIDNGQNDEGVVVLYSGSSSGLATTSTWSAETNQGNAGEDDNVGQYWHLGLGTAGDVNGDGLSDIVWGAAKFDNGNTDNGKAWLHYGQATIPTTTAGWTSNGGGGMSVNVAGDVNGDGYADALLQDYGAASGAGAAYVYYGTSTGLPTAANWTKSGINTSAYLGAGFDTHGLGGGLGVGPAGDVNGDGYSVSFYLRLQRQRCTLDRRADS